MYSIKYCCNASNTSVLYSIIVVLHQVQLNYKYQIGLQLYCIVSNAVVLYCTKYSCIVSNRVVLYSIKCSCIVFFSSTKNCSLPCGHSSQFSLKKPKLTLRQN